MGITALTVPVPVAEELQRVDLWIMLAVTLLLLPIMMTDWRISRREGLVLLCAYLLFIGIQF